MTFRQGLLWLMLVSLGLSAVAGALAVLTAGSDVIWRVVGTGCTAALAAGLLLALSFLLDKEKSRSAGLLGTMAVVVAFLLTLALIWDLGSTLSSRFRMEESMALTLLAVLIAAPPAMLFLGIAPAQSAKWAARIGLATCATAFVLMLLGSWFERLNFYDLQGKLWGSALVVGASGLLAAGSLAGAGTDRRHWRWVGVAAAFVGLVLGLVGVWRELHEGGFWPMFAWGLAVIIAHANLSLICPLTPGQQGVRVITIGAVVLAMVLLDASAWKSPDIDWETANRGAGAAGVVAACGSLALLILARLNRRMGSPMTPPSVKDISITCPWCQRKQIVPLGESNCVHCGLRFRIAVEEPRCPRCDYLLYMLQSDRCPECGTPIVAQALTSST
jgi:hypothetical protein